MRFILKIKTAAGTRIESGIYPTVWDAIAAGDTIKGQEEGYVTAIRVK